MPILPSIFALFGLPSQEFYAPCCEALAPPAPETGSIECVRCELLEVRLTLALASRSHAFVGADNLALRDTAWY